MTTFLILAAVGAIFIIAVNLDSLYRRIQRLERILDAHGIRRFNKP